MTTTSTTTTLKTWMTLLLAIALLPGMAAACLPEGTDASNTEQNFFDAADSFFKTYVSNGRVDYAAIKKQPAQLNSMVEMVEAFKLEGQSKSTQKAFWLNSYNILVIKGIVQRYPIASPMDADGFFDKVQHVAAGKTVTLNDIENNIIRPTYKDARIHFVLVCAAIGCPQITNFAYRPEKLDTQLDQQAKSAMNNTDFIRVKDSAKKVEVSEIFKWYKDDFLAEQKSILEYVNHYRTNKIPADYEVGHYTYNWKLNEKKK